MRTNCIAVALCLAPMLTGCEAFASGEEQAARACESFVTDQLRSPSTYNRVNVAHAPHHAGKSFRYVSISYDADNAFGTPIRGAQVCAFKVDPNSGEFPSESSMKLSASLSHSEKLLREVQEMNGQKAAKRPVAAFDCCVRDEDTQAAIDAF